MIRVELSITFARLIIAHVLLASLTSFLARAQLHLARSLGAEKHRFPMSPCRQIGRKHCISAAESHRGALTIAIAIGIAVTDRGRAGAAGRSGGHSQAGRSGGQERRAQPGGHSQAGRSGGHS